MSNTEINTESTVSVSETTEAPVSAFQQAFSTFITAVEDLQASHAAESGKAPRKVEFNNGRKLIRVALRDGNLENRSAYCFVERSTGDIFKAASWAAPAKHARGSIFTPEAYGITPSGCEYLKVGRKLGQTKAALAGLTVVVPEAVEVTPEGDEVEVDLVLEDDSE